MSQFTPEEIQFVADTFAIRIEELSEEVRSAHRWVAVNGSTGKVNEKHETTQYWRKLQKELAAYVSKTETILAKLKGDAA